MENIKKFIGLGLGFFLVMLSFLTLKTVFLVESATKTVEETTKTVQAAKNLIDEAKPKTIDTLESLRSSAEEQKSILQRKEVQRSITLLAQSGDDWARLPINLNTMIREFRSNTLPNANVALGETKSLLEEGTKTLSSANTVLQTADKNLETLTKLAGANLEELRQLLADESIKQLLGNLADTTNSVKTSAIEVEASSAEIRKAIPELVTELKNISHHIDDGTAETTNFIKGLNKPQSKKEKVFRFLVESILKSSPALLRR